ncbi:MAG TPA: hypothetical protein PKG60_14710 [Spirochaetota bacterium]|nr:hypothetical protein [Spirochaetota bacterium]HPS88186.1 hypothetical protein [Spirochaetota bacterium]
MKKFLVSIFLTIMVIFPLELSAGSANVGANLWYAWFEPGFKNEFMGKNESTSYGNSFEMTEPAAIVYGGLFAVQFTDRISLGGVFSYGTGWECKADYIYNPSGTEVHIYKSTDKMERFEGDLTINYALNNIFKIFFGWKYFGERGEGEYYFFPTSNPAAIFRGDFEIDFNSTGPGVGLSSIFNLANNLYLITTVSGIYQKSQTKTKITGYTNREDKESNEYFGGNGLLNLAYVIPETNVTLSLGGRYQYLKNMDDDTRILFYGVVLSAIYAFNI